MSDKSSTIVSHNADAVFILKATWDQARCVAWSTVEFQQLIIHCLRVLYALPLWYKSKLSWWDLISGHKSIQDPYLKLPAYDLRTGSLKQEDLM